MFYVRLSIRIGRPTRRSCGQTHKCSRGPRSCVAGTGFCPFDVKFSSNICSNVVKHGPPTTVTLFPFPQSFVIRPPPFIVVVTKYHPRHIDDFCVIILLERRKRHDCRICAIIIMNIYDPFFRRIFGGRAAFFWSSINFIR